MKSITSFLNIGLLQNDFKRFSWIGIAYFFALILSVPLNILMRYSRAEHFEYINYLEVFSFTSSPLQLILLLTVPILTALLLFRYTQSHKEIDLMHALPIKREIIYNTHIVSGIIFLFVPLILTALISFFLISGLGIENVGASDILSWLAISLLMSMLFFMTCAGVGMFTGIYSVQGILSYILLFLPSGLALLLLHNLNIYIYGFAQDYYLSSMTETSPMVRLSTLEYFPLQSSEIIIYLIAIIILYFAGRYLYQKRQLETAGNAITFDILRPFFKYSVTFCTMLLLGSYFQETQISMGWTYFGYFLGAIIGYFLMEILLNKSLAVFKSKQIKGFAIFSLISILLIVSLHYDLMGYEDRIPDINEVENVYLSNSFYNLHEYKQRTATKPGRYEHEINPVVHIFTESQNIANIYALHQEILTNKKLNIKALPVNNTYDPKYERICLAYELKNGSRIYRQYSVNSSEYENRLKAIYESKEYKQFNNKILQTNSAEVKYIEITAWDTSKHLRIIDPVLIKGAIDALQKDIYAQSYTNMKSNVVPWAQINISLGKDHNINLSWQKSYQYFDAWLIDNEKYNQARILPEDLLYAVIEENPLPYQTTEAELGTHNVLVDSIYLNNYAVTELAKDSSNLVIRDKAELEICLRNYQDPNYYYRFSDKISEHPSYRIHFLLSNKRVLSGAFSENNAPDFIKEFYAN